MRYNLLHLAWGCILLGHFVTCSSFIRLIWVLFSLQITSCCSIVHRAVKVASTGRTTATFLGSKVREPNLLATSHVACTEDIHHRSRSLFQHLCWKDKTMKPSLTVGILKIYSFSESPPFFGTLQRHFMPESLHWWRHLCRICGCQMCEIIFPCSKYGYSYDLFLHFPLSPRRRYNNPLSCARHWCQV